CSNRDDITAVAKAIAPATNKRIHVFLATSAIHRQHKLNMAQEEIIKAAVEGVKTAREFCEDVEFSPEDASRTELDFLTQVVEAVIEAGATTVNIPDTVGYTVPDEFAELFRYLRKNVRGIDKVRLSVPSICPAKCSPCQWVVVTSVRLLVMLREIDSSLVITRVGPKKLPL